jgi:hypothetical protein
MKIHNLVKRLLSLPDNKKLESASDPEFFLKELSEADRAMLLSSGETFLELTGEFRLDWMYKMKDAILDKDDPEFKDYDPRSLSFMLDKMIQLDKWILESVKQIDSEDQDDIM